MNQLCKPTRLGDLLVKNRLIRSATWDGLARKNGTLPQEVFQRYRELAEGDVGTIVTGLTDVSPFDSALPGSMRLSGDDALKDYQVLTELVHGYGCRILTQLNMNHYSYNSDKAIDINYMSTADISHVVDWFTQAAQRAYHAGFDGVQLHLAYNWFLSRFLNPQHNQRKDEWGNSIANRVRIVREIAQAIRAAAPTLHISAKYTFITRIDDSVNLELNAQTCHELSKVGIDSLEVLGPHGPLERGVRHLSCYEAYARAIKPVVTCPVILTGNNHDVAYLEALFNEGVFDFAGLSRALIREPTLPNRWASGDRRLAACISCNQCYKTQGKHCIYA